MRRGAGFTLIEMLVVLMVLGLVAGLVATRGPIRSRGLDLRATAADLAETLRLARAQAIATNRVVQVMVDAEAHVVVAPDGRVHPLPADIRMALLGLLGPVQGPRMPIRFAPDGSSTGGAVEISADAMRLRVGAQWLSGQVRITDVP